MVRHSQYTIVKVQQPFMTSDPDRPWLVYAKGKVSVQHIPDRLVPKHVKEGMAGDLKAYFKAEHLGSSGWSIGERVKDKTW